jgi:hypothetical protein
MADVAKIEDRVYNLEQYALLSQIENSLINYDVIDSVTGKSRYKSGYLVETFNDPEQISDVYSSQFLATYSGGRLYPRSEQIDVGLMYSSTKSSNFQNTNGMVTLPYTEVVMAKQHLSTRVTNVNPFSVFSWKGNLKLNPSIDNYVDNEYLPTIFSSVDVSSADIRTDWSSWNPAQWAIWLTQPIPVMTRTTVSNINTNSSRSGSFGFNNLGSFGWAGSDTGVGGTDSNGASSSFA